MSFAHSEAARKRAAAQPRSSRLLPHADYASRARAERLIAHLHRLGPRAVGEFLDELCRRRDLAGDILAQLEGYARITPEMVRAVGADRFAAAPLWLV